MFGARTPRSGRRSGVPAAVFALLLAVSACGDSTGVDVAVGAYILVTVDGTPLPWIAEQDAIVTVNLVSAFLHVFEDDCRFDAAWNPVFADGTQNVNTTRTDCTWSRDGSELTFDFLDSTGTVRNVGVLDFDGLTLTNLDTGVVFYYETLR